jgi:hypothetical protein
MEKLKIVFALVLCPLLASLIWGDHEGEFIRLLVLLFVGLFVGGLVSPTESISVGYISSSIGFVGIAISIYLLRFSG